MSNPFQDQFLKAGLVDKNRVNKAKQEKYKNDKLQQGTNKPVVDQNKVQSQQAMQQKAEKDRELNRLKLENDKKKAITAEIRQLIQTNAVADSKGDVAYNFTRDDVIKRVYVNEATRKQIVEGRVAIVATDGGYELVPKDVAEKIRQRDANYFVFLNVLVEKGAQDDPYAAYQVPDDLMW